MHTSLPSFGTACRLGSILALLLFVAPPAVAQQPETESASILAHAQLATAPQNSAFRSNLFRLPQGQVAPAQNRELLDWQLRKASAERRRGSGRLITFIGAGIAGGGTLMAYASADSCYSCDAQEALLVFSLIGGGTVATLGAVRWSNANGTLADLERERQAKGFVQIIPVRRGVMARATFSF